MGGIKMIVKKECVKREIAGDTILVPVGKTVFDFNGLFLLNELGSFLWDRLEAAETAEDLLQKILEEYEVPEEEARRDLAEFLKELETKGIL